jgi:hypothetical protein
VSTRKLLLYSIMNALTSLPPSELSLSPFSDILFSWSATLVWPNIYRLNRHNDLGRKRLPLGPMVPPCGIRGSNTSQVPERYQKGRTTHGGECQDHTLKTLGEASTCGLEGLAMLHTSGLFSFTLTIYSSLHQNDICCA